MAERTGEKKKHYWLHVLKLEHDKYYVGSTSRHNPKERIREHFKGFYTAQWVKKHKPIKVLEVIDVGWLSTTEIQKYELHRTRQYMSKYGVQSTRGGILNYSGHYIKFNDTFWREDSFKVLLSMLFCMFIILALLILQL